MAAQDPNRPHVPAFGNVVREPAHRQSVRSQSGSTITGTERAHETARQAAETAERTACSALSVQKERLASGLDDIELVADAEDYTRRHPEIVLGGTLVLELLMSRFLKSTSYRPEYEGEMTYGGKRAQVGTGMPEERMPYESRGTGI